MRRWLGWFALAVIVGMQAGTVFKPLGTVGETRVADWVDLLTPFAILGCAAMVLVRAEASRGQWALFGIGGITFTLGHGLHLAANSVSNVADTVVAKASIVHLWDEVVSHYPWYTGLFLVMAAMALGPAGAGVPGGRRRRGRRAAGRGHAGQQLHRGRYPVAGVGCSSRVGVVCGFLWRPAAVARLLLVVGGAGLLLLIGWGVYWLAADGSVFPQFSELGWI